MARFMFFDSGLELAREARVDFGGHNHAFEIVFGLLSQAPGFGTLDLCPCCHQCIVSNGADRYPDNDREDDIENECAH